MRDVQLEDMMHALEDLQFDRHSGLCRAAGKAAGRTIGMFLARVGDVPDWRTKGASLFLLQSDQEFALKGAAALAQSVRG